jgi:hypothetical protein
VGVLSARSYRTIREGSRAVAKPIIDAGAGPEACGSPWRLFPEDAFVLFSRKQSKDEGARVDAQDALVEMLLDADELERRRLLLMALQTGELRRSEAAELLRLVDRLESVSGPAPDPPSGRASLNLRGQPIEQAPEGAGDSADREAVPTGSI